jgi:carbonic anhydrase
VLGVQHIVVMGHYGCGGIAASIASAPRENIDVSSHIIQSWIGDVRQLYLSSNRTEIVEMRDANLAREARGELVEEPDRREPGFRALVEENVKRQVTAIAKSSLIVNVSLSLVFIYRRYRCRYCMLTVTLISSST